MLHHRRGVKPSESSIEPGEVLLSRRIGLSLAEANPWLAKSGCTRGNPSLLSLMRVGKLGGSEMSRRMRDGQRLLWLEVSKAVALLLIILNHALERMGVYPLIFNPNSDWAPLSERVSQLSPTTGSAWDAAFNAIRYPGLLGEVGVQIFVIGSGLGLTLSAMRRSGVDGSFLRRRLERIAPTWIVVHVLALIASLPILLFIGGGLSDRVAAPWDARFWASLVGFRITPETIYYLVPAWWFIALLIQLYLVFPLLYRWFVRLGPALLVCHWRFHSHQACRALLL